MNRIRDHHPFAFVLVLAVVWSEVWSIPDPKQNNSILNLVLLASSVTLTICVYAAHVGLRSTRGRLIATTALLVAAEAAMTMGIQERPTIGVLANQQVLPRSVVLVAVEFIGFFAAERGDCLIARYRRTTQK